MSRASHTRPDGSAYLVAADVPTALTAIADAVMYCTDDEDCRECAAAPDGLCASHAARLARVPGYRALAKALGGES
ncbi:MAG TPA: hypothetical protein VMH35_18040 [Streptosporangiaceae bacterium]|nr:hypothetical protein [Streptosporangiaceae bacterium]